MTERTVLVVESFDELREFVSFLLESRFGFRVLSARTFKEAQAILARLPAPGKLFAVLTELDPEGGSLGDLQAAVSRADTGSPFWFVCAGLPRERAELPPGLDPAAWILKPYVLDGLTKGFGQVVRADEGPSIKADGLCAVRVSLVLRLGVAPCEVMTRVTGKNLAKIFSKGEMVRTKTLEKYGLRLEDSLYVQNDEALGIAASLARDLVALLVEDQLDDTVYWEIAPETQQAIYQFSQALGLTPEVQNLTRKAVDVAFRLLERHRSEPQVEQLLKQFKVSALHYIPSHSLLLAHVACGLAQRLGLSGRAQLLRLTLAAFLHDITIGRQEIARVQRSADLMLEAIRGQFTPAEIDSYARHPEQAAELARTFTDFPSDVDRIVLEHHELGEGGFPKGLKPGALHPMTRILQVAHEMISFAETSVGEFSSERFLAAKSSVFLASEYSAVIEAIR